MIKSSQGRSERSGKREDGPGHPKQEDIQRGKLQNLHFLKMLQQDNSSYCKATTVTHAAWI